MILLVMLGAGFMCPSGRHTDWEDRFKLIEFSGKVDRALWSKALGQTLVNEKRVGDRLE